ncbi:hypothetical protein Nans01_19090 [Nocardiopsis ansamitocini]|uniref:Uncharacterized protein n=1 Tax=Nocardiopsis ansamitocini TaxID=1670832 RepID=A0A9W6P5V3_9ACTN|nr:hypothetical protein Nans01_19090 [Nocardiopsis ansamitocini]
MGGSAVPGPMSPVMIDLSTLSAISCDPRPLMTISPLCRRRGFRTAAPVPSTGSAPEGEERNQGRRPDARRDEW